MASGSNTTIIILIVGIVALLLFGCKMGIKVICKVTGKEEGGEEEAPVGVPGEEGGIPEQYPIVSMTEALETIADMIVTDISKGTSEQLGRRTMFDLKADLFTNYKSDMAEIAEYNEMRLQPFEGEALALYSRLLLELAGINGIELAPAVESAFKSNLFASSPPPGTITASRARSMIIG